MSCSSKKVHEAELLFILFYYFCSCEKKVELGENFTDVPRGSDADGLFCHKICRRGRAVIDEGERHI